MNTVVERRIILDHERQCLIPNPGMTILGGCERLQIKEEDSVFLTPKSSPAYSTDGSAYSNEISYFASAQPSPTSMGHMDPHSLQPALSNGTYMAPVSPCEEFCGSPYSPPYDNPSPHSIGCSTSPHGSPASIIPCSTPPHGSPFSTSPHGSPFSTPPHGSPFPMPPCTDSNQFTPYISPSPSLHDIPSASLPLTSGISHPYDNSSVIYSNVPNMSSNYFLDTAHPHWMNGNAAPNHFDTFPHSPGHMFEGEIPVAIIDQLQRGGGHVEMEMTPQLNFYPSPSGSPERHPVFFHDMPVMAPTLVPSELTASPPCPPYSAHKPAKSSQKKKPKPPVKVNDEYIKDIPTSSQLWEFTLRVLKKPPYHYMINWENRKEGLFRFHDAPAFAALWGKHRNRPNMTYDKVARALRYYYKRDILNQVGGRLTYRFSKRLGKLYASDE